MIFYWRFKIQLNQNSHAYIWMASIVFRLLVVQQKHFILLFDKKLINHILNPTTYHKNQQKWIGREKQKPGIWRSFILLLFYFFLQAKRNFIYDNFQHLSLTDIPNLLLNDRSQQTKYVQSNLWIYIEFTITFALFLTLCAEEFFSCTTLSYCTFHLQCMAYAKKKKKNIVAKTRTIWWIDSTQPRYLEAIRITLCRKRIYHRRVSIRYSQTYYLNCCRDGK